MDFTQDEFDRFLAWLHPDREQAGTKYKEIQRKLIKFFICRGCAEAEDLADETISRVIRKIQEIINTYEGDPALYFYGVARHVYKEYLRRKRVVLPLPPDDPPEVKEQRDQCLEECMKKLSAENRRLVLEYYKDDKREKIDHRKEMADRLGIAPNALRIRMHRIRTGLQVCVAECLERHRRDEMY